MNNTKWFIFPVRTQEFKLIYRNYFNSGWNKPTYNLSPPHILLKARINNFWKQKSINRLELLQLIADKLITATLLNPISKMISQKTLHIAASGPIIALAVPTAYPLQNPSHITSRYLIPTRPAEYKSAIWHTETTYCIVWVAHPNVRAICLLSFADFFPASPFGYRTLPGCH